MISTNHKMLVGFKLEHMGPNASPTSQEMDKIELTTPLMSDPQSSYTPINLMSRKSDISEIPNTQKRNTGDRIRNETQKSKSNNNS